MDPFTIITGALKIADATGLSAWLGNKVGGSVGAETAKKITGIATQLTGAKTPEEALEMIKADRALAAKLKEKILDNEHELTLAHLEDVQSARQMYQNTDHTLADEVARSVYKWNILYIFLLIGLNILAVIYLPNPATVALVSNLVGVSIAYLWNERATVLNFLYGSSSGSKDKSKELMNAVKKSL